MFDESYPRAAPRRTRTTCTLGPPAAASHWYAWSRTGWSLSRLPRPQSICAVVRGMDASFAFPRPAPKTSKIAAAAPRERGSAGASGLPVSIAASVLISGRIASSQFSAGDPRPRRRFRRRVRALHPLLERRGLLREGAARPRRASNQRGPRWTARGARAASAARSGPS